MPSSGQLVGIVTLAVFSAVAAFLLKVITGDKAKLIANHLNFILIYLLLQESK